MTATTESRRLRLPNALCGIVYGGVMLVVTVWVAGCDTGEVDTRKTDVPVDDRPAKPAQVLSFPDSLHVPDESVNDFVEEAMGVCARGAYDDFRLLWSAKEEPLQEAEFNAGWKAVLAINVRALDHIRLAVPSDGGEEKLQDRYVFLAEVRFDPLRPAGRRQPTRQVVLLIGKEQDQWRLARAPAKVRTWVRDRVADAAHRTEPVGTSPEGSLKRYP